MSDVNAKLLSSRLYTEASAELEEKVEEEKKVPDPVDAESILAEAEIKDETQIS